MHQFVILVFAQYTKCIKALQNEASLHGSCVNYWKVCIFQLNTVKSRRTKNENRIKHT